MRKSFVRTVYGVAVILAIWVALHLLYDSRLIPGPIEVASYLAVHVGEILLNALISLFRIFSALLLALAVGISLGIVTGAKKRADNLLTPIVYVLYPVPKIAFLSIILIFFGLGDFSKIFLIFFIIVFQITLSVRDSVKNIDRDVYFSIYHLSLTKGDILRHVILPIITPNLLTSVRISIATGFSVLFLAENFATEYGIGYFIIDSWIMANYVRMFAGIVTISILGSIVFLSVDFIEKRLCRYKYIGRGEE